MNTIEKIRESNRIEGIHRAPTEAEVQEFARFMELGTITIPDLQQFVAVYAPGNPLRDQRGLDVFIGSHEPESGGPAVRHKLAELLQSINSGSLPPWQAHVRYEMLHPFMDGNGRSGRMLWYWQMEAFGFSTEIGFLHSFYYQTLQHEQGSSF